MHLPISRVIGLGLNYFPDAFTHGTISAATAPRLAPCLAPSVIFNCTQLDFIICYILCEPV